MAGPSLGQAGYGLVRPDRRRHRNLRRAQAQTGAAVKSPPVQIRRALASLSMASVLLGSIGTVEA